MQIPNANNANKNKELIFPELSYKIIGVAFSVFNELGWSFSEKHYQKVLAEELKSWATLKLDRFWII